MSEQALAAAVIQQAFEDLTAAPPEKFNGNGQVTNAWSEWRENKEEALLFLTSKRRDWMKSRDDWCAIAGFDSDKIVRAAQRKINKETADERI